MTTQAPFCKDPDCLSTSGKALILYLCLLVVFSLNLQAAKIFEYYASDWAGPSNSWNSRTGGQTLFYDTFEGSAPQKGSSTIAGVAVDTAVFDGNDFFTSTFTSGRPWAGLNQFSLSLVFKSNASGPQTQTDINAFWNQRGILGFELGGVGQGEFALGLYNDGSSSGAVAASTGLGAGDNGTSAGRINDNNWHTLTMVVKDEGSNLFSQTVYVDGIQVDRSLDLQYGTLGGLADESFSLGVVRSGSAEKFVGEVAVLRFDDAPLTASEIIILHSTYLGILPDPTITSTNDFSGTVGVPFSNNITATGTAPIEFSGTGLPAGLSVTNLAGTNWAITGTPTMAGTTSDATLTATNVAGTNNQAITFTIAKGSSTISVTGSTSFTFNGSEQGPDTSFGTGSTGAVTYSYAGTGGTTYGPSAIKPSGAGSYSVTATVAADSNYDGASSAPSEFTITNATPSDSSFSGWLGMATPSADLLVQYAYGAVDASTAVNPLNYPSTSFNSNGLVMTYYVRKNATNPNLVTPQVGTNLTDSNSWVPVPSNNIATVGTSNVNGVDVLQKTVTVPIDSATRKFLWLKISE